MRLVDGDSVASVARQLYMSESTVKTHVARVYEKLGAHNRASAIMLPYASASSARRQLVKDGTSQPTAD